VIDVAVVGGGPVGLVTALYAGRAGLSVRVYEQRPGVVDKACGEGLMPGALAALEFLGVDPAGHPLQGIRYLAGDRHAEADFRAGAGRGVRRTTLHRALLEAVAHEGIEVRAQTVRGVGQSEDAATIDGERARYLVAADGLHSSVRRQLGLQRHTSTVRRHGLRVHVAMPAWTDYVEVTWSGDAETYVTPVDPNLVNVAVLSAHRHGFEQELCGFPVLRDRIGGRPLAPVRGAGPLRQVSTHRVAGRVLLVGDASGYVDALTGEGLNVGFAQARAAITAICAGRPSSYERAWRRITWRHRLITTALLTATRSAAVRRSLVPAAERLPGVFSVAVNELARAA
jgi:flavin-dependent dehydrogenase